MSRHVRTKGWKRRGVTVVPQELLGARGGGCGQLEKGHMTVERKHESVERETRIVRWVEKKRPRRRRTHKESSKERSAR